MATRLQTIVLQPSIMDRRAIERKIEELIALLDEVDGDPDLEDDDPISDPLDIGEAGCNDEARKPLPIVGGFAAIGRSS